MTYIAFIVFSTIEFFVIIFLGLCMFRVNKQLSRIKYLNLFYLSLGLSTLSLILKYFDIFQGISPIIFMLIIMFSINPLTKIKKKLSLLIGSLPYLIYGLVQNVLFTIMNHYGIITFDLQPFALEGYILQIATSLIYFTTACLRLHLSGGGFVFNPDKHESNLKYSNKLIAILIFIASLVTAFLFHEASSTRLPIYIHILTIVSVVSTILLLFISHKRNEEEVNIDLHKALKIHKKRRE